MNEKLINRIEQLKGNSAWSNGVKLYALELVESAEVELTRDNVEKELLNGAVNWSEYSYGGCALIYDGDIAERLCPPSELKKKDGGRLNPNSKESWLDVQARALRRATSMIKNLI